MRNVDEAPAVFMIIGFVVIKLCMKRTIRMASMKDKATVIKEA